MYCTINDLKDTVAQDEIILLADDIHREQEDIDLTWPPADPSLPLDPVLVNVNKAIKKASDEIDTDLGARFVIPFNPVPDMVVTFTTEIALYYLYLRRRRQNLEDPLVTRYKQIKDQIKRLADGYGELPGAKLVNDTSAATSGNGEFMGSKTSKDKMFTKKLLDKYQ